MAAFRSCGHIASQDLKARGLPWHVNLVSYDAATGHTSMIAWICSRIR
jgi:hypothetical protein